MSRFLVGIPTLCRYDLLDRCIDSLMAGTVVPAQVLVIDNGGAYKPRRPEVVVVKRGRNLGVAASWNLLMKRAQPTPIILCNDDVAVGTTVCERLLACSEDCVLAAGFSCFRLRHETFDEIGPFDETFWPAYLEENDYRRRLRLAGKSIARVAEADVRHPWGSTRRSFTAAERAEFERCLQRSRNYYLRKWGGLPGREVFKRPFDGAVLPAALLNRHHGTQGHEPNGETNRDPRLVVPSSGLTPETRLRCSYGASSRRSLLPAALVCIYHGEDQYDETGRVRTRDCPG